MSITVCPHCWKPAMNCDCAGPRPQNSNAAKRIPAEGDPVNWKVLRKGRPSAGWRILASGSEVRAREVYNREYVKMRQGVLQLVDPDGTVVKLSAEPMVRTRW